MSFNPVVISAAISASSPAAAADSAAAIRVSVSVTKAQDLYRKTNPTEPLAKLTLTGSALIKQRVPAGAYGHCCNVNVCCFVVVHGMHGTAWHAWYEAFDMTCVICLLAAAGLFFHLRTPCAHFVERMALLCEAFGDQGCNCSSKIVRQRSPTAAAAGVTHFFCTLFFVPTIWLTATTSVHAVVSCKKRRCRD